VLVSSTPPLLHFPMPRRALRKIDPALDLTRHLKWFDELPRPWDAGVLFGRHAPLEVEVGTGKGLFLQTAAAAMPQHNFLGAEIAQKYARFAAARLASLELPNALVVNGDAQRLFAELLPDASLKSVHVYFPDPWWKKRHFKRRVMNQRFVRDVARTLLPHGVLHFWTDVQEYFESSTELIAQHTALVQRGTIEECPATHALDYRTHYERRTRLGQQPVYRAEFHK
jgi:tRNA (guanine-N7-)-methyltransferase